MSLDLMLADVVGATQTTKGDLARQALDRGRRVRAIESRDDGLIHVWLCGYDGMAWVGLSRDELTVLADHACTTGHPDAEALAAQLRPT